MQSLKVILILILYANQIYYLVIMLLINIFYFKIHFIIVIIQICIKCLNFLRFYHLQSTIIHYHFLL